MTNRSPVSAPIRVLEVELAHELPSLPARTPSGGRHRHALALVRLHAQPLGLVTLDLGEAGLTAAECADRIWAAMGAEINEHLIGDGLAPVAALGDRGLPDAASPACMERRQRALANAPSASVVIATRDRPASLAACLDSVMALEYPDYEVVVVDNAPASDATRRMLDERYADTAHRVRYVSEPRPGLAVAHNRGLDECDGEIVAFTDDDVVVDRLWLLELARGFMRPRVGCVTGMILAAELETAAQVWLEQYGGFAKGFEERQFDLFENRPPTPLFPYTAGMMGSGANMAFRAELLRRIGGFDPATGAGTVAVGGDDLAAFFDVVTHEHTVAYTPSALLWHYHRRDYEGLRRQAFHYGVGLTAYLTRTVLDRPSRIFAIGRLLPSGLAHLLSPSSPKNAMKHGDYPKELTWLERWGMVRGPASYVRSRRHSDRLGGGRPRPRERGERRGHPATG